MTLIVGLVEDGKVYMGGDSQIVYGNRHEKLGSQKVFIKSNPETDFRILLGSAGYLVNLQVMQFEMTIPKFTEGHKTSTWGMWDYLHNCFVPEYKKTLKEFGNLKTKDGIERTQNEILVGVSGRLFIISSDGAINEYLDGYGAIGSGSEFALGVLHILKKVDITPEEKLKKALEAAQEHCYSVAEPFYVEEL